MKYKAVVFDLDDTLIKSSLIYRKSLREAVKFLAEKYSLEYDRFYEKTLEKHFVVRNNFPSVHTRHSRILVFRMVLDEFVEKYDLSDLPLAENIYWEYFLENIELYDGVYETLETLRTNGIKTAIISDGDLNLRIRKVSAVKLHNCIDELVASEEVIFEKPFSAIFTLVLSRLKVEPDEALMIGNNYKNDIRGAQLVGMDAALFDPEFEGHVEGQDGTIHENYRVRNFQEILKIVGLEE